MNNDTRPLQDSAGAAAEASDIPTGSGPDSGLRTADHPDDGVAPRGRKGKRAIIATVLGLALVGGGMAGGMALDDPTESAEYLELQAASEHTERQRAALEERQTELDERAEAREEAVSQREAKIGEAEAAVAEAEAAVKAREEAVTGAEAEKAANTISDGTWTVGRDIASGTYRSAEPVGSRCYWGIYRSGSNGSEILENDIPGGGHPTVTLAEGQDFTSARCGKWDKQ